MIGQVTQVLSGITLENLPEILKNGTMEVYYVDVEDPVSFYHIDVATDKSLVFIIIEGSITIFTRNSLTGSYSWVDKESVLVSNCAGAVEGQWVGPETLEINIRGLKDVIKTSCFMTIISL